MLGLGLDNRGRTTKNAYRRIYSLWFQRTCNVFHHHFDTSVKICPAIIIPHSLRHVLPHHFSGVFDGVRCEYVRSWRNRDRPQRSVHFNDFMHIFLKEKEKKKNRKRNALLFLTSDVVSGFDDGHGHLPRIHLVAERVGEGLDRELGHAVRRAQRVAHAAEHATDVHDPTCACCRFKSEVKTG